MNKRSLSNIGFILVITLAIISWGIWIIFKPRESVMEWVQKLVNVYVEKTNNPAVRDARKLYPIECLMMGRHARKSDRNPMRRIYYYEYRIGHTEPASGSSPRRFVTDASIYVDEGTGNIYELNEHNGNRVEWNP